MKTTTSNRPNNKELPRFEDLPWKRQKEVFNKVVNFLASTDATAAKVDFTSLIEGLDANEARIAKKEFLVEDHGRRKNAFELAFVNTYRDDFAQDDLETLVDVAIDREETSSVDDDQLRIYGFTGLEPLDKGTGATAIVYLARQMKFDRPVAVKVARKQADHMSKEEISRFKHEARLQAKHLNAGVPAIFATGYTEDRRPYIAMELVDGQSLEKQFSRIGRSVWPI